ncbi:unnamed protein product [Brachionus calyciflorus]|uniref:Uncharacterized protein n=1 Tax=Brachionus calyciflorus TaxID=104777 RepID=A0A814BKT2_9BILA|nr:unnamed protein product [Brachionus calyciflorus]
MVNSKSCEGYPMRCNSNGCQFDGSPNERYKWLRRVTNRGHVCSFKSVQIKSKETVFNKVFSKTTLIWNKNIIKSCTFRVFSSMNLDVPFDNIFSNNNGNQIFKVKSVLQNCGYEIFETTEVFFLTYNTNLASAKNDERVIHDLVLSESDSVELKSFTALDKLREELCNIELANIREFRVHENKLNLLYVKTSLSLFSLLIELFSHLIVP